VLADHHGAIVRVRAGVVGDDRTRRGTDRGARLGLVQILSVDAGLSFLDSACVCARLPVVCVACALADRFLLGRVTKINHILIVALPL